VCKNSRIIKICGILVIICTLFTELVTLTYDSQQSSNLDDYIQQFLKWFTRNMEIIGPGGTLVTLHIVVRYFKSLNGLIAGDGDVHIIDKDDTVVPLRTFTAKNLAWLLSDEFSTASFTYTHELSKDIESCI
jgi:hypothetical protein